MPKSSSAQFVTVDGIQHGFQVAEVAQLRWNPGRSIRYRRDTVFRQVAEVSQIRWNLAAQVVPAENQ